MPDAHVAGRLRGKVVVAPDSFKGTLGASEVVAVLAGPFREAGCGVDGVPLAAGGEGTGEAPRAEPGGERIARGAPDPLGGPLRSWYAAPGDGDVAIVETAAASGLGLVPEAERDPERASTRGTGE